MNSYLTAQLGFIVLTAAFLYLFLKELRNGIVKTNWTATTKKRTIILLSTSIALWLLFVGIWSASGVMSDFTIFPFNFLPVIAIPLVSVVLLLIFSRKLSEILAHIPSSHLIRLQVFRVFVELLLWMLFAAAMLPKRMTFEGQNFDVLAGLTAPLIAFLVSRKKIGKTAVVIWNLVSFALLINIVFIGILSAPGPWQIFREEPSNTIVTYFPFSWLPGFLVPLAYILHFLSLKQLWAIKPEKQQRTPNAVY